MNNDVITDRTVIDVMAFTMNAKSIGRYDKERFEEYAKEFIREYDYIFYISPYGIPIENNGVRETDEHYRDIIDFTITTLIRRYSHIANKIEKISGSTDERIKQILKFTNL
jgi:uncharacterized protein YutD